MPNQITILILAQENISYSVNSLTHPHLSILNFYFAENMDHYFSDPFALIPAFSASAGRYMEWMLKKTQDTTPSSVLVMNPLIKMDTVEWDMLFQQLNDISKENSTLFASADDLPIALFIPNSQYDILKNSHILRFLSCASAILDKNLLATVFENIKINFITSDFCFSKNGAFFTSPDYLTINQLIAAHYLQANQKNNGGEYIAVMPYHAGDVLFFCLAFRDTAHSFNAIVVNACSYHYPQVKLNPLGSA